MSYRPETERWQTPLGRFVREHSIRYGGNALPETLGVTRQAIYHYVSGRFHPRPLLARKMCNIAAAIGMPLGLDDVYETNFAVKEESWVTEWAADFR